MSLWILYRGHEFVLRHTICFTELNMERRVVCEEEEEKESYLRQRARAAPACVCLRNLQASRHSISSAYALGRHLDP